MRSFLEPQGQLRTVIAMLLMAVFGCNAVLRLRPSPICHCLGLLWTCLGSNFWLWVTYIYFCLFYSLTKIICYANNSDWILCIICIMRFILIWKLSNIIEIGESWMFSLSFEFSTSKSFKNGTFHFSTTQLLKIYRSNNFPGSQIINHFRKWCLTLWCPKCLFEPSSFNDQSTLSCPHQLLTRELSQGFCTKLVFKFFSRWI